MVPLVVPEVVRRARWLRILLGACLVLAAAGIWLDLSVLGLMDRAQAGHAEVSEGTRLDQMRAGLAVVNLVALGACAIVWMCWLHGAVRNLRGLGTHRTRFTPGWSVGWWFIPFANIVRPPQIMGDTWRRSASGNVEADGDVGPMPDLVLAWWLAEIASNVLTRISASVQRGSTAASQLKDLVTSTRLDLMSNILDIAAAVMAILIVQRITRTQTQAAIVAAMS